MIGWKQWKTGLWVAGATGALTGIIGLGVGITVKQAMWMVSALIAKDWLLYLTDPAYRDKVLDSLPNRGDENGHSIPPHNP